MLLTEDCFYHHFVIIFSSAIDIDQYKEYYSDIYMRRHYRAFLAASKRIDAAAFMGDLFDGVTLLMRNKYQKATFTEEEYRALKRRWDQIFQVKNESFRYVYVAGNHDIGFAIDANTQQKLAETFEESVITLFLWLFVSKFLLHS